MEIENKAYLKVIHHIKKLLLSNKLSLGDKLPTERELSEILNLSRNSIREAIKIMESMGIIESRHGSGNYLVGNIGRSFTDSLSMMILMKRVDYLEVSQLRRGIEIQALSIAIDIITEDDLSKLNLLVTEMESCNEVQQGALDKEFHYSIVSMCKNDLMISIMQSLSEVCDQFIDHILRETLKNEKAFLLKLHKKILESIVQKNLFIGIEAINEHYNIIDKGLIAEENSDV